MKKVTQEESQLSQGLAQFEPMVPCQGSLMAIRGYTRVNGKWVAPASNVDELTKAKMKPHLSWGGSG